MGRRIDGWKAIAAYLGVSRNTALTIPGLPVSRLTRRIVCAWSGDLDAWVRCRPAR